MPKFLATLACLLARSLAIQSDGVDGRPLLRWGGGHVQTEEPHEPGLEPNINDNTSMLCAGDSLLYRTTGYVCHRHLSCQIRGETFFGILFN